MFGSSKGVSKILPYLSEGRRTVHMLENLADRGSLDEYISQFLLSPDYLAEKCAWKDFAV